MLLRSKKHTNPLFDPERLRLLLGEERADRALTDPDSVDLLTWNVFSTLDSHRDHSWLAYRLQALGGPGVTAPVRLSLWTGAQREPLLRPPAAYVAHVREVAKAHGGDDAAVSDFAKPVEVPVRLESPGVLALIDTTVGTVARGRGGRDRLVELIDVGIDAARRLGNTLTIGVVYASGTAAAAQLSARVNALRDPHILAEALPHRPSLPTITLRELSWQQLIRTWHNEADYLELGGQPVRGFLELCRRRGLS
ncbi:MAG: hypothetical protein M3493_09585 [Actinomycetota bacterium]|jgi:hypothetical protein|nr:hypothetical protein [Actinomycetota bacterium]